MEDDNAGRTTIESPLRTSPARAVKHVMPSRRALVEVFERALRPGVRRLDMADFALACTQLAAVVFPQLGRAEGLHALVSASRQVPEVRRAAPDYALERYLRARQPRAASTVALAKAVPEPIPTTAASAPDTAQALLPALQQSRSVLHSPRMVRTAGLAREPPRRIEGLSKWPAEPQVVSHRADDDNDDDEEEHGTSAAAASTAVSASSIDEAAVCFAQLARVLHGPSATMLTASGFVRVCEWLQLLGSRLTAVDAEMIWGRFRGKGSRLLGWREFQHAMEAVGERVFPGVGGSGRWLRIRELLVRYHAAHSQM